MYQMFWQGASDKHTKTHNQMLNINLPRSYQLSEH